MLDKTEDENRCSLALSFAEDFLIIQDTVFASKTSDFEVTQICERTNMNISSAEIKEMTSRGKEPIKTEIIINMQPIDQVSHYNYLGNVIIFDKDFL